MKIREFSGKPQTGKSFWRIEGFSTDDIKVPVSDHNTMMCALLERVFYEKQKDGTWRRPYVPPKHVVTSRLKNVRAELISISSGKYYAPVDLDESLRLVPEHKRKIYVAAYKSLMEEDDINPTDAHVSTFLKVEKHVTTKKANPVPRVVSPRSPRYNLVLGKYLRTMEKHIYQCIDEMYGYPVVAKGMNPLQVADTIFGHFTSIPDCVVVGMDASRFDQHVNISLLEFEHSVYRDILRAHGGEGIGELSKLLRWQTDNKCRAVTSNSIIKYSVQGTRMSGDLNTSLGNVLLMTLITRAYLAQSGLKTYRVLNNGDDQLVFLPRRELHKLKNLCGYFGALGLVMELEEPVSTLEHIEFCQCKPVYTGTGQNVSGHIMVRNVHAALIKDTTCILSINNENDLLAWMNAVAKCGMSISSGVPVVHTFYKAFHSISYGAKKTRLTSQASFHDGLYYMSRGMTNDHLVVTPDNRMSFWKAFGVTPHEQIIIEEYFTSLAEGQLGSVAESYSYIVNASTLASPSYQPS